MTAYYMTKDVAGIFGIQVSDVAYWCRAGHLKAMPRTSPGQPWRIPKSEVERLAEEGLPPSRRTLERP